MDMIVGIAIGILDEIDGAIATPLLIDKATKNRLFGHYASLLVGLDHSRNIFYEIMVKQKVMHFRWKLNTRVS